MLRQFVQLSHGQFLLQWPQAPADSVVQHVHILNWGLILLVGAQLQVCFTGIEMSSCMTGWTQRQTGLLVEP